MSTCKIRVFKNRKIFEDKPVRVYRCLTRKGVVFSVKQGQYVYGHTSDLTLENVKFVISESGKKKAMETGTRNVHAFVEGMISKKEMPTQSEQASYYPFKDTGFYLKDSEQEISGAVMANFSESGLTVFGPILKEDRDKDSSN